jgi:transposase
MRRSGVETMTRKAYPCDVTDKRLFLKKCKGNGSRRSHHWQKLGVWQQIHAQLRTQVRRSVDKTNTPTASIIDSQSVKTAPKRGKYTVTMAENR